MLAYVSDVWNSRYFWLSLTLSDLRTRYRRSFLGIWWSLLNPILMTAILCLVFHKIFNVEIREFAPYLLAGLSFWNFFTTCTHNGCQCFKQGEAYIRQYPAPLAIYSLRAALGAGFHFFLAIVCVIAMTWLFRGTQNLEALPSLLPTLALLLIFGWSVATIAGLLNVHFPDIQHLFEVVLQLMFYATPVMYPAAMLERNGLSLLLWANPLVALLSLLREPLLDGRVPNAASFGAGVAVTATLAGIAVVLLVRWERRLVYYL